VSTVQKAVHVCAALHKSFGTLTLNTMEHVLNEELSAPTRNAQSYIRGYFMAGIPDSMHKGQTINLIVHYDSADGWECFIRGVHKDDRK